MKRFPCGVGAGNGGDGGGEEEAEREEIAALLCIDEDRLGRGLRKAVPTASLAEEASAGGGGGGGR